MSHPILISFTCDTEKEAKEISDKLIEDKLVACVQIFPFQSRYWWDGSIQEKVEFYVSMKTLGSKKDDIESIICNMHSYEVPAIEIIKIDDGNPEFLDWVSKTVS